MSPSPYAVRVSAPAAKVLDALPEHAADTVSDILAAAAAADPFGFGPRYLWPGRPASRPIGGGWALTRLKRHGLLSLSARNTAMIEFVAELPPIGVSDSSASAQARRTSWSRFTQDSRAGYLAACSDTE